MPVPGAGELRSQIHRYLLDFLPRPEDARRPELAEYARLLRDYPERGGKMLRGTLCLYAALAHGASFERALPVAAALELFQNWALVHDDIEDGSEERRGRPTLHRLYGVPLALNAGDALHAFMWALLVHAKAPQPVFSEFAELSTRTARGQHLEISWLEAARFDLTGADYLEMVSDKAAYYTAAAPLRLGPLIVGEAPPPLYLDAGLKLGTGFQIMDDVLNLAGDNEKYGKEIAGDVWEGKRTLILLHYLRSCAPEERSKAERLLRTVRESKKAGEVAWLHSRLLHSGAVQHARGVAEKLLAEGLSELKSSFKSLPNQEAALALWDLLETLVRREA